MPNFLVKIKYLGIKEESFFGGDKLNYHQFSVINSDEIPDDYFAFPEKKINSFIFILEKHLRKQVKKTPLVKDKSYVVTLNLGKVESQQKIIRFGCFFWIGREGYINTLVLKSGDYFRKAIKGEIKPTDGGQNGPNSKKISTNPPQNNLIKTLLIIFPILLLALFFIFFAKWINKKRKS